MPAVPRPDVTVALSRRLVLTAGAVLTGGALAGCDLSDLDPRSAPSSGTPSAAPTLQAPAPADQVADVATLRAALDEVLAASALVEAVVARHRRLRADLRPVLAMHRAHADLLSRAAPPASTSGSSPSSSPSTGASAAAPAPAAHAPRRPGAALALVRRTEATTGDRLTGWAVEARSGTFARLLAGMAAGVAQQVAVLPTSVSGGRP